MVFFLINFLLVHEEDAIYGERKKRHQKGPRHGHNRSKHRSAFQQYKANVLESPGVDVYAVFEDSIQSMGQEAESQGHRLLRSRLIQYTHIDP